MEAQEIIATKKIGASYRPGDARDLADTLIAAAGASDRLEDAAQAVRALAEDFSVARQYGRFAQFVLGHAKTSSR
jgi:hypothetical protein